MIRSRRRVRFSEARACAAWVLPGLLSILLTACISSKEAGIQDGQYGHRFGGDTVEGRLTVLLEPPGDELATFEVEVAAFDTVHIRPELLENADDSVLVEVLVKGAFPDGCTDLHDLTAERQGRQVEVDLLMRRRSSEVCTQAVRPYRFYFDLPGHYFVGQYAVILNQRKFSFQVGR